MVTLWRWNSFILLLQVVSAGITYQVRGQIASAIIALIAAPLAVFLLANLTLTIRSVMITVFRKEKPSITVLSNHLAITTLSLASALGATTVLAYIEGSQIETLTLLLLCLIFVVIVAFIKTTTVPKREKESWFLFYLSIYFLVSLPMGPGTFAGLAAFTKQAVKRKREKDYKRFSSSL